MAVATRPQLLESADFIVLPGVGAFGDGMRNLNELGLVVPLKEEVLHKGKPFLGICLGMQLLAATGTEFGVHEGLGWIKGAVIRIEPGDPGLRVPHIGWNSLTVRVPHPLFQGLQEEPAFYFVHSYQFVPDDRSHISTTCDYGGEIVAAVQNENIYGVQFHPEKSHREGLTVLKNFLDIK